MADSLMVEIYRSADQSTVVSSRRGVKIQDVEPPPRWHRCFVHTEGWLNYFTKVERCPCGAICYDHRPYEKRHHWMERNTARRTDA